MKKILTMILLIPFFFLPMLPSYAQTETEETKEEIVQEENQQDEDTEESLSDKLDTTEEELIPKKISFLTILGAILIPSIFIIICYMILKFFKF